MKSVLYLGAAIALLRSAAALYSHHDQNPMVRQQGQATNKAANSTLEHHEIPAIAQVAEVSIDDDAVVLDTENVHDSSPHTYHPPNNPPFHVGTTTSQWAMTYTPYNNDLTCKSPPLITADIASIAHKGFPTIRLPATDCSALPHIAAAAATHNLTLILGIHIDDSDSSSSSSADALTHADLQLAEIIAWATSPSPSNTAAPNPWSLITLINLGNEAIFNAYTTPSALATHLHTTRAHLRTANYTGPLTTTEPISILTAYAPTLCPALDILASNIHPFFNADISAETAGAYVAEQLDVLEEVCPGLQGVNLETGWPRGGRRNGIAVPGVWEQGVAVGGILGGSGGRSVVLGFGDDGWKDEGEFGVERSWGCGHLFGGE